HSRFAMKKMKGVGRAALVKRVDCSVTAENRPSFRHSRFAKADFPSWLFSAD
ncbi:hypothetical protein PoB_001317600, partial [Plakobranchus ocellatus]